MSYKTIAIGVTVASVAAVVGYAIWFDYKRRNDPNFRKKIQETQLAEMENLKKEIEKKKKAKPASPKPKHVLDWTTDEIMSASPEKRIAILQELLSTGEATAAKGPSKFDEAARYISKAARLLPNAGELLRMIEQSYPPLFFEKLLIRIKEDGIQDFDRYLSMITPANSKAKLMADKSVMENPMELKRIPISFIATQDIVKGDVVFREKPVVSVLCNDLESNDNYCFHCQKALAEDSFVSQKDRNYCSEKCQKTAWADYEKIYNKETQADLNELATLTMKYIAKSMSATNPSRVSNHIETMDYAPSFDNTFESETSGIKKSLVHEVEKTELITLLDATTYTIIRSLVKQNSYAFGLKNSTQIETRSPESYSTLESFRCDFDRASIKGVGFYQFAAYMSHSSTPNVKMSFTESHELEFVALEDIKSGSKICFSKVPII